MMARQNLSIRRRRLLGLAAETVAASPWLPATSNAETNLSPTIPVVQLDNALLAAMKAGSGTPFNVRYRALGPIIDQVFNLDGVLAASIGLSWPTLPERQKAALATAFRRYTISSFVSNFNSYNGQNFAVLPAVRAIGDGDVVVSTRLLRVDNSPLKLDYVVRNGPLGWQIVDVLTDGVVSRVAVQRSDFRGLLRNGGVPALTAGLERKYANLSGEMQG